MSNRQVRIEQKILELSNSIAKIEDSYKWVWRTIMGALLVGALAIVFGI